MGVRRLYPFVVMLFSFYDFKTKLPVKLERTFIAHLNMSEKKIKNWKNAKS